MKTLPKLREQKVWQGTHRGVAFKIASWDYDSDSMRDHWPSGSWNFYIYLREVDCLDFDKIWLPDVEETMPGSGRKYITHDYLSSRITTINFHGGCTYYEKHGHIEGHRCVEVGCDYQHYYDEGRTYGSADVAFDVTEAIDSAFQLGILKPDEIEKTERQTVNEAAARRSALT